MNFKNSLLLVYAIVSCTIIQSASFMQEPQQESKAMLSSLEERPKDGYTGSGMIPHAHTIQLKAEPQKSSKEVEVYEVEVSDNMQ